MELITIDEKLHDLSVSIAMLTNLHVHFLPNCEEVERKLAELMQEMKELINDGSRV